VPAKSLWISENAKADAVTAAGVLADVLSIAQGGQGSLRSCPYQRSQPK
jgi:hypothetical protein